MKSAVTQRIVIELTYPTVSCKGSDRSVLRLLAPSQPQHTVCLSVRPLGSTAGVNLGHEISLCTALIGVLIGCLVITGLATLEPGFSAFINVAAVFYKLCGS